MTYQFDAIYDNGVIRPLEPVVLPDQSRIKVTVEAVEHASSNDVALADQRAAFQELWAELDKLPQHENNDGWSVRDHDKLLYDELQQ
ncbi:MAG: antitoxin family protein [Pirellulales bacterium]